MLSITVEWPKRAHLKFCNTCQAKKEPKTSVELSNVTGPGTVLLHCCKIAFQSCLHLETFAFSVCKTHLQPACEELNPCAIAEMLVLQPEL